VHGIQAFGIVAGDRMLYLIVQANEGVTACLTTPVVYRWAYYSIIVSYKSTRSNASAKYLRWL